MNSASLNGEWLYRIGRGPFSPVTVPFSRLPVGHSECVRRFDLPRSAPRIFLKLDGITYYAKVSLNGSVLGEMLPYCEYEFDITDIVQPKDNELTVELEDIDRAFGPSEGWENFGGIIRDVHLLLRESAYIENVFFRPTLSPDLRRAEIRVETEAVCPADACSEVIEASRYVSEFGGGKGAVRDIVEQVLRAQDEWAKDRRGVLGIPSR